MQQLRGGGARGCRKQLCSDQKTHVAVSPEVLEQLDLAQCALGENLLAKDICDLLDGDAFLSLVVDGGAASVRSRQHFWAEWRGSSSGRRPAAG